MRPQSVVSGLKSNRQRLGLKCSVCCAALCLWSQGLCMSFVRAERTSTLFQLHLHYFTLHPVSHYPRWNHGCLFLNPYQMAEISVCRFEQRKTLRSNVSIMIQMQKDHCWFWEGPSRIVPESEPWYSDEAMGILLREGAHWGMEWWSCGGNTGGTGGSEGGAFSREHPPPYPIPYPPKKKGSPAPLLWAPNGALSPQLIFRSLTIGLIH